MDKMNNVFSVYERALFLLEDSYFWSDPECPVPGYLSEGHPRFLVVSGANASGKSFFVEVLRGKGPDDKKYANVQISIRERTGAGTNDMAGLRRTMMFGDESEQSTGATSVSAVMGGFRNMPSRLEDGGQALLVLDEPELGLSSGYAVAMGAYIAEEFLKLPENGAVVVVTHSKEMVRQLQDVLGQAPSFAYFGSQSKTLDGWLTDTETFSVEDLMALRKLGHERRQAIEALLRKIRESRKNS